MNDDAIGLDDELEASPHSPEDASRNFQEALKILDESPGRLAKRMQRLGDYRPLSTITRAIQRMAAGETRVSGEMLVVVQMMVRERQRAEEDVQRLRWSQVGGTWTASTRDFAISLTPQPRGRWKVSVTHIPSRYSPDWPVWQTSLAAAKVKAVLCIDDAINDPDPELARTLRTYGQPAVALQGVPTATAADFLALATAMNTIALQVLEGELQPVASVVAKISVGMSLQAARLVGEAILVSLGWSIDDLRKRRNHDLLTILRQAETAIQESGDAALRPYAHFTLVPPVINGTKYSHTIAAHLQNHLAQGPTAAPENYFNADEPRFLLPNPVRAVYEMVEQLLDAARKVVAIAENAGQNRPAV